MLRNQQWVLALLPIQEVSQCLKFYTRSLLHCVMFNIFIHSTVLDKLMKCDVCRFLQERVWNLKQKHLSICPKWQFSDIRHPMCIHQAWSLSRQCHLFHSWWQSFWYTTCHYRRMCPVPQEKQKVRIDTYYVAN